jgi:hypothetical protein
MEPVQSFTLPKEDKYVDKLCPRCEEWKEASSENFRKNSRGPGTVNVCKECEGLKRDLTLLKKRKKAEPLKSKWCEGHRREHFVLDFDRSARNSDGFNKSCRTFYAAHYDKYVRKPKAAVEIAQSCFQVPLQFAEPEVVVKVSWWTRFWDVVWGAIAGPRNGKPL